MELVIAADGPTTRGFDYFCGYTHSGNMGMVIEQDKVAENLADVAVRVEGGTAGELSDQGHVQQHAPDDAAAHDGRPRRRRDAGVLDRPLRDAGTGIRSAPL